MSSILTAFQKAVLVALADKCSYSLSAHVPVEAVQSKFSVHLRGDVKSALKKLVRRGFCIRHPTRGSTTFQLSQLGLEETRKLQKSDWTAWA